MGKNAIITGQYINPTTIKVTSNDHRLLSGQRVLVYRPTDKKIYNYSNGRIIGNKEKILGSGTVQMSEGQPIIITQNRRTIPKTYKSSCNIANRLIIGNKGPLVRVKGRMQTTLQVYIKPITE